MRKLILLADGLDSETWEKYGKLVATLSLLEWFLEEAILNIVLKRKFDASQKVDAVLRKQISGSRFSWKIKIIEEFDLLSLPLKQRLDDVRRRRNIFIHGIGLKIGNGFSLQDRKGDWEAFTAENISAFTEFVENTGGTLLDEFESAGFKLSQPESNQASRDPSASV